MQHSTTSHNGKYKILVEINMIPLIDVSLVLLIIFMVMTPFLVRSKIKLNLPRSGTAERAAQNEKVYTVQVQKDGRIFVDGQGVAAGDLEKALRQAIPNPRDQAVVVEADKDVPLERFITVVDAARRIGVGKFSIAVKQDQPKK
jgi:biopolymer transport protein ExbD